MLASGNDDTTAQDPSIFHFNLIDELPVTAEELATETRKDPLLSMNTQCQVGQRKCQRT